MRPGRAWPAKNGQPKFGSEELRGWHAAPHTRQRRLGRVVLLLAAVLLAELWPRALIRERSIADMRMRDGEDGVLTELLVCIRRAKVCICAAVRTVWENVSSLACRSVEVVLVPCRARCVALPPWRQHALHRGSAARGGRTGRAASQPATNQAAEAEAVDGCCLP